MTAGRSSITRLTTLMAATFALLLTIVGPAVYFAISYQYMIGILDAQAELNSRYLNGLIVTNPEMWQYEQVRLVELLERRMDEDVPETHRIWDLNGNLVAEHAQPVSLPRVSRGHVVYDAGHPVARIEIIRSLRPVLINTGMVAVFSALMGCFVFWMLKLLPLRAVKKAYSSLEESEKRYRSLYDSMKEGMVIGRLVDGGEGEETTFSVVELNPACEQILGRERNDIIGMDGREFLDGAFMGHLQDIANIVETRDRYSFDLPVSGGERIFDVSVFSPEPGLFAALMEDVTENKKSAEQIQRLAYYDNLTCLPNRLLMHDRLNQALALAMREQGRLAVMFIDLDQFKVVNDSMGHAYGDLLLVHVAQRLRETLRSSDTIARLGGDEFVVITSFIDEEHNAAHIAQHLIDNIVKTYHVSGRDVYISASIGIALFPEDGLDAGTLLKNADMAMYAAKDAGRNAYSFYSKEMNRKAHDRMEMENDLRFSIENGGLFLEYQPIISARDLSVTGCEVLVRWQHPEHGRTMPDSFIPMAEESGFIHSLGEWVLRSACQKMKEWRDAGYSLSRISVNVSGRQFEQGDIVNIVSGILAETKADPRCIELELTETTLMKNAEATVNTLFRLKELSLGIAVDDFGAGYSSLSYLKNFPIDRIKIDRSFVKDISNNPSDRAIVEVIIAMAGKLGLDLVAEGVETLDQLEFLKSRGCNDIQGYYFHRPLPEAQFVELLKQGAVRSASSLQPAIGL